MRCAQSAGVHVHAPSRRFCVPACRISFTLLPSCQFTPIWRGNAQHFTSCIVGARIVDSMTSHSLVSCLAEQFGPAYKLCFGPKSFIVISDPVMIRHILKENAKAYDKGVLAEILEPIMGKGLIPADPATWKVRRRAIVPGFHKAWLNAMVRELWGRQGSRVYCGNIPGCFRFFSAMSLRVRAKRRALTARQR